MNRILSLLVLVMITGCKETPKPGNAKDSMAEEVVEVKTPVYPKALNAIFEAHGGLENWRAKSTMSFTMPKSEGDEVQTIDLRSRKEKIVTPDYSMGYDGKDFWLADAKEMYKGDPIFYHNLMFYFYAMPFVLADEGIQYNEVDALEYQGKSYPGIRISYDDGIGVSSKDEYFLYYDPDTNQVAWLGYTVTYRSGEKSEKVNWIRYNDWQNVDGLVLPKSLTWHKVENGDILGPSSTRIFENVSMSNSIEPADFFAMPANGKIIEKH